MARHARVVTWNGKDLPPELRELPAGRYVVEAVDDEAPILSPEEEAGIIRMTSSSVLRLPTDLRLRLDEQHAQLGV